MKIQEYLGCRMNAATKKIGRTRQQERPLVHLLENSLISTELSRQHWAMHLPH